MRSSQQLVAVRMNGVEMRPGYRPVEDGEVLPDLPDLNHGHPGDEDCESMYKWYGSEAQEVIDGMPEDMAAAAKGKGLNLYLCPACLLEIEKGDPELTDPTMQLIYTRPVPKRLRVAVEAECQRSAQKAGMAVAIFGVFVYQIMGTAVQPECAKQSTAKRQAKVFVEVELETLEQLRTTGTITPGVVVYGDDGPPKRLALGHAN